MSKLSHFVVVYDHMAGRFYVDNPTCEARFQDGWLYEKKTGWRFPDGEDEIGTDDDAGEFLANLLKDVVL